MRGHIGFKIVRRGAINVDHLAVDALIVEPALSDEILVTQLGVDFLTSDTNTTTGFVTQLDAAILISQPEDET